MDGVTILNIVEKTVYTAGEFNDTAAIIAIIVSVIVVALIGLAIGYCDDVAVLGLFVGALLGLLMGLFMGAMCGGIFAEPDTYETVTQYEVILDDNVSMNEFCDKYQIVEQRGDIFVVEEKQ